MNRQESLNTIQSTKQWDILIIGGGATGLGTALDAASRGYKTLLVEKHDFGKGTSSKATKLVHGGVRYLAQGNIKLVMEALKERGRLLRNAPHLTSRLSFVLPVYSIWDYFYYGIGLLLYDLLSANWSLGATRVLSKKGALKALPGLSSKGLVGGVRFYDGQFDDTRLAVDLAKTATTHGATIINYCSVHAFEKSGEQIVGAWLTDHLSGYQFLVNINSCINATGVFAETVMQLDEPNPGIAVSPSQGIHLVVDQSFFPGQQALIIPKTDDGRVLFAVPWQGKVILGTTDTPVNTITTEPQPMEAEIDFVISHFNRYCSKSITRADVLSVFAGLRPLVKSKGQTHTSLLSRDHSIIIHKSGLVSIVGGKWTTYRKMAQDAVDNAVFVAGGKKLACKTKQLPIGNWQKPLDKTVRLFEYGNDAAVIRSWMQQPNWAELIHPNYAYTKAEIRWHVEAEMAMTVEDVLARRIRLLFLDAKAAMEAAPIVAALMAELLQKDQHWQETQVNSFRVVAQQYLLS